MKSNILSKRNMASLLYFHCLSLETSACSGSALKNIWYKDTYIHGVAFLSSIDHWDTLNDHKAVWNSHSPEILWMTCNWRCHFPCTRKKIHVITFQVIISVMTSNRWYWDLNTRLEALYSTQNRITQMPSPSRRIFKRILSNVMYRY